MSERIEKATRETKLVKNTFILAIGTFLPKFSSFIVLPILTGWLTQEEYGTYDLVMVLVSLVLPAATLQIQSAAFRFLIDSRDNKKETEKIVTNILFFITITSIIALTVLWAFLPTESNLIKFLICLYFFADIFETTTRQITRGFSRNLDYSISAIITSFGNMLLVVLLVRVFKLGMIGALCALCFSTLLSFGILCIRTGLPKYVHISNFDWDNLKEMLQYSWPMVPNVMSLWVMRMSDRLVVTFFMGVTANAIYAVANKIPSLLNLAQAAFTMAWQENAALASKDEDVEKYYSQMFRTSFDVTAGIMSLLVCSMPILFKILIRGSYELAYKQMPILIMALFFHAVAIFLGGIYIAHKKTKSVGFTTSLAAAANLVIDIALIRYIGLYAASGSTLISYALLFLFRLVNIRSFMKLSFEYGRMIGILGFMTLECVLCYQQNFICDGINLLLGVGGFYILNRTLIGIVWRKIKKKLSK